ncbi:MAG TPA: LPXTG cell wall anchor domain-containing protein, partial [Mycobacteriales bacterium]|nr:LPXTG cell wall anchor domain-containing protein [Mycobacteriales bacterium]
VLVGYADGCVEACVKDPDSPNNVRGDLSVEDVGVIARQFCGRGLFEEYDDSPDGPMAVCARAEVIDPSDPLSAPPPTGGASPAPRPTRTATAAPRVDPLPTAGRPLPSTGGGMALPAVGAAALAFGIVVRRRRRTAAADG